jgi:MoxR-like ATPase
MKEGTTIPPVMDVAAISDAAERLRANIETVMVGKGPVIELALTALLCQGHVLIEDVPGSGKTTLAKAIALSLGCSFRRIQFTPDMMPSDITGLNYFNQKTGEFELRQGPVFAQVVLADEVNRATPRTQSALLEAMQERQVTIEGATLPLPQPFLVLATQNPIELEGTFPLPEAQLDRFMLRLTLGYPTLEEEAAIVSRFNAGDPLAEVQPVAGPNDLREMQSLVPDVRVDASIEEYLINVVRATRGHASLDLGASPRATLALHRACQALAAQRGRDYVTPDDVKQLAPYVLGHRLILTAQARLRGQTAEAVVQDVLRTVPVPVVGQPAAGGQR